MKQVFTIISIFVIPNFVFGQKDLDSTKNEKIFTVVESNPDFPGGLPDFFQFIKKNLKYPKDAKKDGITGKVIVEFTIGTTGKVIPESVKVIQGLSASCDEEAVRVIKKSPNWLPGRQHGKAVPVKYSVPVTF